MKKSSETLEREKFLNVYSDFSNWLFSLGFRQGHFWKESSASADYNYSHYENHIKSLYGVEHYVHDVLRLSIRFLRDKHEHKIMFVCILGSYSKTYTIEEAKDLILSDVRKLRDEKIEELNALANL